MARNGNGNGKGWHWQPPSELNEAPPTRELPRQHPQSSKRSRVEGGGPLNNLAGMTEDTRSTSYSREDHTEKKPY